MSDPYWMYAADPRQQMAAGMAPPPQAQLKRPRPEYPAAPEMLGYYPREDERTAPRIARDTATLDASYDQYLRSGISYPPADARPVSGGLTGRLVDDARMIGMDGRTGCSGGRQEAPLPPDASNTVFVEGLPANCTRREVSHIFRPFVGFREVRLVNKESRHAGGDPLVLCFVDFATPSQAAIALEALQGHSHEKEPHQKGGMSLNQFFLIAFICSFAYYVFSCYLFQMLTSLSWICWLFPTSVLAQQLGSGLNGLGIGAIGIDWSSISSYLGSPLTSPWFATANVAVGFFLIMYIITPIAYWSDLYHAKSFPIFSDGLFMRSGKTLNISILTSISVQRLMRRMALSISVHFSP